MASKRNLLLTLDAFGTLFKPKRAIGVQYGEVARQHGLTGFTDQEIQSSFKEAYKAANIQYPSYGKSANMSPAEWWSFVIRNTFKRFNKSESLPSRLVPDLLTRFSSSEGYEVFPDVLPFFKMLQKAKTSRTEDWRFDCTVVGILTNSDNQVSGVLKSLGLRVNEWRIGRDQDQSLLDISNNDIDFLALSYDIGVPKPARAIFRAVKNTLMATEPHLNDDSARTWCVHVGDSIEEDVRAATRSGWTGMLIDRYEHQRDLFASKGPFATFERGEVTKRGKTKPAYALQDLMALRHWDPEREDPAG